MTLRFFLNPQNTNSMIDNILYVVKTCTELVCNTQEIKKITKNCIKPQIIMRLKLTVELEHVTYIQSTNSTQVLANWCYYGCSMVSEMFLFANSTYVVSILYYCHTSMTFGVKPLKVHYFVVFLPFFNFSFCLWGYSSEFLLQTHLDTLYLMMRHVQTSLYYLFSVGVELYFFNCCIIYTWVIFSEVTLSFTLLFFFPYIIFAPPSQLNIYS